MLDAKVQSMVCEYLWKQEQSGASITLFSEILIQCIHASIYTQSDNRKELFCYIASEKSPELERIVTILIWLFLPMEYKLKPYWGNHFAVIGEAQTMILGQIML